MIEEMLKKAICNGIERTLTKIFTEMYENIEESTEIITISPADWQGGRIWGFVESIQANVALPIAALILTFFLVIEINNLVIEKNRMAEVSVSDLFMIFIKVLFQLIIITHALDIVKLIFEIGNWVSLRTVSIIPIGIGTPSDLANEYVEAIRADAGVDWFVCLCFWLDMIIFGWVFNIVNGITFIVVYGRLMQMILYASFSAIPLATFINKDWGEGQNYIKNLLALAFQGFVIILVFGIYTILISEPPDFDPSDIYALPKYLLKNLFYAALLCMTLTKTNSMTQSIFGAH